MEKKLLQCRRLRFDPWVKKIPWRREQLPTPVFLPGEFSKQRRLAGYHPWGHKESDMTELLRTHMHRDTISLEKKINGNKEGLKRIF